MNTSKRKFNALLNSLGSKSTTTLSSTSGVNNGSTTSFAVEGDTDLQSKRRRVVRPISVLSQAPPQSRSTFAYSTKSDNMGHNKSLSLASAKPTLKDSPTYAPWDRTAFLRRLESFKSVTEWTPKPAKVNEVEWAKRGWVCRGPERVRCELCNVEMLVKVNVKEVEGKEEMALNPSDIEVALVGKYAGLIITGHSETCLWQQRGCDNTIFRLLLNHAPTTVQGLRTRYDALCSIHDRLTYMHNIHLPEDFDLDSTISYLPKNFFPTSQVATESPSGSGSDEINRVAFLMAVFGWTAQPESKLRNGAAICEACFRTLGLWLFKSKEVNEAGEVLRPAAMNYLDPIEEHREYCPWRNAKSQSGGLTPAKSSEVPELAGWQVILRVLKNDYRLRQASNTERQEVRASTEGPASRPGTAFTTDVEDEDAKSIREEKDKERWARLRRVKSLFDIKSLRKLHRSSAILEGKGKDAN